MGRKVDAITVHTGMSVDSMLKFRDMNTVISEQWEKKSHGGNADRTA